MVSNESMGLFKLSLSILILSGVSYGIFMQPRTRNLCVISALPSVQSMCVKCDASKFNQMSQACTGQFEVPANTTQQQAFCLLSTCLRQIPQTAQPIGRRKRQAPPQHHPISFDDASSRILVEPSGHQNLLIQKEDTS